MERMPTIAEALIQGLTHHRGGQLQAAEQLYRQVLQADPEQADAWHLLGVLAHQVGQPAVALDYIGRAIQLNPSMAAYHANLGTVYQALGRLDEAAACFRDAV